MEEELSDSVNVVMQWDEHNETLSQRTHSKRSNRTAEGRRCAPAHLSHCSPPVALIRTSFARAAMPLSSPRTLALG